MEFSRLPRFIALCLLLVPLMCAPGVRTMAEETSIQLMTDAMEWPSAMSLYEDDEEEDGEPEGGLIGRRSLFWRTMRHYYISYGALSANRIPCPPRSGRSYYTPNCYKARGPVHPYTRGCSAITRCRS